LERNNCSNERLPGIHILGGKPEKHSGKGDREEGWLTTQTPDGQLFSYMETSTLPLKHPSKCNIAWKEITVVMSGLPVIHILGGKPKKHSGKGDREEEGLTT
jgi:hypothetical protein